MLLILSENTDLSTSAVIEWLLYYDVLFERINGEECFIHNDIKIEVNGTLAITMIDRYNRKYDLSKYSFFWYRRSDWYIAMPNLEKYSSEVMNNLKAEWEILRTFIHSFLEQKKHIGSIQKEKYHNKLLSLRTAQEVGLKIPSTFITTDKKKIEELLANDSFITKAIKNMFTINYDSGGLATIGTTEVNFENIELLGNMFFPTLLQKKIKKLFELRIFFLKDIFFAMAIFSQLDEQTKIDFRNYNYENPTRNIPFLLPKSLGRKLKNFIKKSRLDTGSIDMIVDTKNDFYFLEVNPVGQFGWLSNNCNYYIEESIAHYFKNNLI